MTKFGITILVHTDEGGENDQFIGALPYARDLTLMTPYGGAFYRATQCATQWARCLEELFRGFGVVNSLIRATGAGPR